MTELSVVPYEPKPESGACYRECMRNHAASIGGQAYDGCGEFMPGGETGSLEALKCAACGCHRNFHRREGGSFNHNRPLFLTYDGKKPLQMPPPPFFPFHAIPPPLTSAPPAPTSQTGSETPPRRDDIMDGGDGARSAMRKRYRTKFTVEQKEKMHAFAEKLGWRIQKHDDVALQEFCVEIGVKRHVMKVWMHNNKNHLSSAGGKQEQAVDAAAASAAIAV